MDWWGYSKEHGWVVLDRSIPSNGPGLKGDLLFLRCRDSTTFVATRESWNPPLYKFAPNHIRELAAPESAGATAELEGLKARWPEFQLEIQRQHPEIAERAEAARLAHEKERQKAAREKKKQDAAANN